MADESDPETEDDEPSRESSDYEMANTSKSTDTEPNTAPSDSQIIYIPTYNVTVHLEPHQPKKSNFPVSSIAGQCRGFQTGWYTNLKRRETRDACSIQIYG